MAATATANTVRPHVLPELRWAPTRAQGPRHGSRVRLVVVHRWGVRYSSEKGEADTYRGVVRYFQDTAHEASAHLVYPGSAVPGEATQMVPWHLKAWTEAFYNPDSVEVESADAIWLRHDPAGFHQLAHIVVWLLHHWRLPPVALDAGGVVHGRGFCRHADLGKLGGDHPACPTTSPHLWDAFAALVRHEHHRGGFRDHWGRA